MRTKGKRWLVEVVETSFALGVKEGASEVVCAESWSAARRRFVDRHLVGSDPYDRCIRCTLVR